MYSAGSLGSMGLSLGVPERDEEIVTSLGNRGDHFPMVEAGREETSCLIPVSFSRFWVHESEYPLVLAFKLVEFSKVLNEAKLIVTAVELQISRCASSLADA